jgi:hypothetical protein
MIEASVVTASAERASRLEAAQEPAVARAGRRATQRTVSARKREESQPHMTE